MADVKTTSAADTKAAAAPAAAPAPTAAAASAGAGSVAFEDVFDVHPAGLWDATPFGVAGAWPFASATALVPPLPAFGSFAFPSFPPLPALPVPVWSSAAATHAVAPKIALDLVELPDRFTAIADLPGVHANDIDLRVDRDARVITVAVVRRRTANCDCNFVQTCAAPTAAAAATTGASAGAKAADTKAAAAPTSGAGAGSGAAAKPCECVCDGKCKAKAVHCRDCEAKGELMGPAAPNTPLVNGCCGFCAGALHLKSKCGRGKACAAGGAGAGVYRRSERQFGRGERSFRVPSDADLGAVASSLRGGVLTITVPRVNAKAKAAKAAADPAADTKAHAQYETAGHAAAATAADPKARAAVLQHHVTAPNDNPAVVHERVMRAAAAAGADPRKRAALLTHHLMRADPLSAWPYHSPFAAYSALLPDVMSLARDWSEVSHHVTARPPYDSAAQNPLLLHERVMRHAVAAAQAHTAQAQAHSAAAVQSQAAANAQMAVAESARAAATEMAAEAAAASAAGTTL